MSELASEGRIQKFKGKVQSAWDNITDDDFDRAQGKRDQMVGMIKEKTDQAEEEIRRRLDDLEKDDNER